VHSISDIRQVEGYTAEQVLPGQTHLGVEFAIEKSKRYKSPSSDLIPANLLKQDVKHCYLGSTNKFIIFGIWKNCLFSGRSLLLCEFTKRALKLTVVIIMG
jgi:hypothetical protein